MSNWIEWCPLIGPHFYIYIVFKALNLSGTDIIKLTFKLLNPQDGIKVLERGRKKTEGGRGWRGAEAKEVEDEEEINQGEGLSYCVLGETVKQDDSTGLLFERLPGCQFRCNIFIDTLLTAA